MQESSFQSATSLVINPIRGHFQVLLKTGQLLVFCANRFERHVMDDGDVLIQFLANRDVVGEVLDTEIAATINPYQEEW